ncbi:hypothetical protein AMR72_12530 [Flavobacterium psychrophilum]|nr:hypothetical protein AMR72_12530 [Flavobacterium psychrophilum]AOE53272.1 hypothetical protein ALW18_12520 [Flavobacterium psychrophilum]
MKIKIFFLIAIVAFAITGAAIFVNVTNDHKECSDITKQVTDADGNIVTVKEHVCKEKFNL